MNDELNGPPPQPTYEYRWATKWVLDGAATPAEMAARLRETAGTLDELAAAGVALARPIEDGHGVLLTTDQEVADQHGFEEAEWDEDEEDVEDGLDDDEMEDDEDDFEGDEDDD